MSACLAGQNAARRARGRYPRKPVVEWDPVGEARNASRTAVGDGPDARENWKLAYSFTESLRHSPVAARISPNVA